MSFLRCQKEFAVLLTIIIATEAGAILISFRIALGFQAFVIVNARDLICKL